MSREFVILSRMREDLGLAPDVVADILGLDTEDLTKLERGLTTPTFANRAAALIDRYCSFLDQYSKYVKDLRGNLESDNVSRETLD
jgi:hypothetical protein